MELWSLLERVGPGNVPAIPGALEPFLWNKVTGGLLRIAVREVHQRSCGDRGGCLGGRPAARTDDLLDGRVVADLCQTSGGRDLDLIVGIQQTRL